MPVRIAHLSDIHFGGNFDGPTWNAVRNAVRLFNPNLIIVSGASSMIPFRSTFWLQSASCAGSQKRRVPLTL
jgi:hypothetical protein